MKYPDARLLVLSKAPDPGHVKTRLIPLLGESGAAGLYTDLLCSTLEMVVNSNLCPVDLWCSPVTEHPFFQQCRQNYGVQLRQQTDGDLGQRMSYALSSTYTPGRLLVLIGADCPALSAHDLEKAFDLLDSGAEVVIGPAEDGGYYLIGMRGLHPYIFSDVPWSSASVLSLTEARLSSQSVKWESLELYRDIDTPDDYHSYMASGRGPEP